jgi:hypothetical protein
LFKPEGGSFNDVMDRIQARRDARSSVTAGESAASPDVATHGASASRWERRRSGGRKPRE